MAKEKVFVHPVSLELTESVLATLAPESGPERTKRLASLAAYFLTEYARGGIMLTKRDLDAIERATDKVVQGSQDIVDAVCAGMGRKDGQYTVSAAVDPAWVAPLREVAEYQGCTLDELLTNCINTALGNGWLYSFNMRSGGIIPVEGEGWDILVRFMGKGAFSGKELAQKIADVLQQQEEAAHASSV